MARPISINTIVGRPRQRPLIPLKDTKGQVKLRLRRADLQKELDKLPSDTKSLVELLIQSRDRVNYGIYETVTIWNKLRLTENYWRTFNFNSEPMFLAHYGLPDGTLLATWTVLVELFDRATFIMLGDATLLFMMRWVSQYQSDFEKRREDFQAIFERYCRERNDFDRNTFYSVVQMYVAEKYEKPLARTAGLSHEKWLQTKGRMGKKGPKKPRAAGPDRESIELELVTPHGNQCRHCTVRATIIRQFLSYTQQLEYIIREKLSSDVLPSKDRHIARLQKLQSSKKG